MDFSASSRCRAYLQQNQKGWDTEDDSEPEAVAASRLNKLFVFLKSCKERAESYFKCISFSTPPPA